MVLTLPNGRRLCFACMRIHLPEVYQNIANWVKDHPPLGPV